MRKKRQKQKFPRVSLPLIAAGVLAVIIAAFLMRQDAAGRPVTINGVTVPPAPALSASKVAQGEGLYAQYCAACHGANLEGAPDWKKTLADGSLPPPPHDGTGHTWHHPDGQLLNIIANGGSPSYNSKMPGFSNVLTEDEMDAILEYIKSRWGTDEREFQWWVTNTR
ncbi:MAG: cytochrome c [Anaerolineales bacterium]|jgi:mono/diheme cytochrome c family protein|nr:cytochrome c [Anaerolineales bacterium]